MPKEQLEFVHLSSNSLVWMTEKHAIFTKIAYLIQLPLILILYHVQIHIKLHMFVITHIRKNAQMFYCH